MDASAGRAQPPTNVEIHWSHDPATGATRLTSTETGREEEPTVWFDGTLAAGGAAVVRGESVLYLGRAAERLVHLVLIGPTLRGRTREEAEALAREGFNSLVADLPGDAVDDASRAALESALAGWPTLRGRLEIGLEAPEGVTAGQLAALFLPWLPIPETQTEVRIRHVR